MLRSARVFAYRAVLGGVALAIGLTLTLAAIGLADSFYLRRPLQGIGAAIAQGATALADLTDVQLSTPSDGQVLKYNGTKWVNGTDATGGSATGQIKLCSNAATTGGDADCVNAANTLTGAGSSLSTVNAWRPVNCLSNYSQHLGGGAMGFWSGSWQWYTGTGWQPCLDGTTAIIKVQ